MRSPTFQLPLLALVSLAFCLPTVSTAAPTTPAATVSGIETSDDAVKSAFQEAGRLVAAAEAEDFFENITDSIVPRLRHRRSGLICSFEPGDRANNVHLYESPAILPGDDVSCGTTVAGVTRTLYATRYSTPVTAEQAIRQAYEEIVQVWKNPELYKGERVSLESEALPQTYVLQMLVEDKQGRKLFTQANTTKVGGWIYLMRLTGPADQVQAIQLLGGMSWLTALPAPEFPGQD
ncbi:MAG: hypothetical protein GC145_11805 [Caulobacter sp.]|nr:hypothetical protein [Caulobacter sp.]